MSNLREAAAMAFQARIAADNPNTCAPAPFEEVYQQPTKVQAKQWTGYNFDEMADFAGASRLRQPSQMRVPQVWNSVLRQWLVVRPEFWIIKSPHGDGNLFPVSPVVYARDYSPSTPTSSLSSALARENEIQAGHRDTALAAVREAQAALGEISVVHLGLTVALDQVSRRVADELTAFTRAGIVDGHTKSRDQLRDLAESLRSMVALAKKDLGRAGNNLQAASGSLRR